MSDYTSILVIPVVPAEVPIAPADLLVTPKVGAVSVISPTRVIDLVDYSFSSDSDLLEDSLPLAPELPLVSPFLCSDDSKANSESKPAEQRPERHESLTPSSEFHLNLLLPHPRFVNGQRFLFDPVRLFPSVDLTAPIPMGHLGLKTSNYDQLVDRTEFRGTMQRKQLELEMGEFRTELAMQILDKQSLLSFITEME
ncbi:hypothetical protein Tco_1283937 [Tanacetum coccineum]